MRGAILAVVVLVAACSSPAVTPKPTPEPSPEGYVTRAEFGEDWPFSVDAGALNCYRDGERLLVTFTTGNGIEYGINGSARDFGFPDADDGMIPTWPDVSMLGPVIDRGLELC